MDINKEAIYSTRPWKIFGEGPIADSDIKLNAQGFNEGAYGNATAQEIRFTQTEKSLYVTLLAWPEEKKAVIKSLSEGNELYPAEIKNIELLGYGEVEFSRTPEALIIELPEKVLNQIAPVFKIMK